MWSSFLQSAGMLFFSKELKNTSLEVSWPNFCKVLAIRHKNEWFGQIFGIFLLASDKNYWSLFFWLMEW